MAKKVVESDIPELVLTPEEIAAIVEARRTLGEPKSTGLDVATTQTLANALITAIEATRPPQKKTPYNRVKKNPYYPKDGSPRLKLKRPTYQHGIELDVEHLYNEDIENCNKLKPGVYCNGHVRVLKRNDGGVDITYPVRTSAQRLKLVNQFSITDFSSLLRRLVDERANPAKYRRPDEDDD